MCYSPAAVYVVHYLVKTYKAVKVRANDGLSFEIAAGEICGLLGPNGAGKTTLVGQLTRILRPDSGTLLLHGRDIVRDSGFATETFAVLSQTPLPLRDLTVEESCRVRWTGAALETAHRQLEPPTLSVSGVSRIL
jgi:ABC-2 type transport system ATP-binding protein